MPRIANTKNSSFYHYRVDTLEGETVKSSKFHFTIKEMCEEYNTTNCCLYHLLSTEGHKPRAKNLKNKKFYRVKKPTKVYVEQPQNIDY